MTTSFEHVPIIELTEDNVGHLGPGLRAAVAAADFIAVDCELTGLGNRKKLLAPNLDDRYNNIGLAAKTRSVIALGISAFKQLPANRSEVASVTYQVQTYNIFALCADDFIVEPASLKFLVEHGFDFSKQYSKGLTYYRGNDRDGEPSFLRQLFAEMVALKKILVVHNGFIDLVFLYQNLYAELPQTLQTFVADLSVMFPSGIYDTKFLSEFVVRTPSSFLEFVFKTMQKRNVKRGSNGAGHVLVNFPTYLAHSNHVDLKRCGLKNASFFANWSSDHICASYAHHGHCSDGMACSKSHDIDAIVCFKEGRLASTKASSRQESPTVAHPPPSGPMGQSSPCHRAGFDAFMTGFALSCMLVHKLDPKASGTSRVLSSRHISDDMSDDRIGHHLYLVGKDQPLLVKKSTFAKNSQRHAEKIARLRESD